MSKNEKTVKVAKAKAPKAKSADGAKKTRAPRLSGDIADAKAAELAALLLDRPGLASSEIASSLCVSQASARAIAAKAIAAGEVFRGGDRRFARYATTQAQADSASAAARSPKAA